MRILIPGSLWVIAVILLSGLLLALPASAVSAITLTSEPTGATVILDGITVGSTPFNDVLAPGTHTLRIDQTGYEPFETTFTAADGVVVRYDPVLVQLPVPGSLVITSTPSGARVYMGGSYAGDTPLTFNSVTPGTLDYWFQKEGYQDFIQTYSVVSGQTTTINVVLTPVVTTGSLSLKSTPEGATVLIGGAYAGVTPLSLNSLTPGTMEYMLQKEGYQDYLGSYTIVAGQATTADITLTPTTAGSQNTGSLAIASSPSGASVYVDGISQGVTPVTVQGLAAGTHIVKIVSPQYPTSTHSVTVVAGQTVQISASLAGETTPAPSVTTANAIQTTRTTVTTTPGGTLTTRITTAPTTTVRTTVTGTAVRTSVTAGIAPASGSGSLSVTTTPTGAQAYLDGVLIGNSPATISGIASGTHTLRITMTGYQNLSVPVTITAGQVTQYSTSLVPDTSPTTKKSPGFAIAAGVIAVAGLVCVRRIIRP